MKFGHGICLRNHERIKPYHCKTELIEACLFNIFWLSGVMGYYHIVEFWIQNPLVFSQKAWAFSEKKEKNPWVLKCSIFLKFLWVLWNLYFLGARVFFENVKKQAWFNGCCCTLPQRPKPISFSSPFTYVPWPFHSCTFSSSCSSLKHPGASMSSLIFVYYRF